MSELERERKAEIEALQLSEEEVKAAIQEGKIKKWFHQNSQQEWPSKEPKQYIHMKDVAISREDAHRLKLNEMNHEGYHIRDGVRYLITPICKPGKAYEVIERDGDLVMVKDFELPK